MSKITIDRSVVEQALEALEHHVEQTRPIYKTTMAIEALIAALEQPQVTSCVACEDHPAPGNSPCAVCGKTLEQPSAVKESLTPEQPQVEQEPVAWMNAARDMTYIYGPYNSDDIPLYTHPQPPRQPLTDEQITELADAHMEAFAQFVGAGEVWFEGEKEFARAIERAHGITGEQE